MEDRGNGKATAVSVKDACGLKDITEEIEAIDLASEVRKILSKQRSSM